MSQALTTELKSENKHPGTAPVLADLEKHMESVKRNLWHGDVLHALQRAVANPCAGSE